MLHQMLEDEVKRDDHSLFVAQRARYARLFAQILFDIPVEYTGYASVTAVRTRLTNGAKYRPSKDHCHGRQRGGWECVWAIERNVKTRSIDILEVQAIVDKYRQVQYVTSSENMKLRSQQQKCSHEAAYARLNVQLVYVPQLFSKRLMSDAERNWYEYLITAQPNIDVPLIASNGGFTR